MRIHIFKVSKKLKNLREERKLTQEEIAKELGVSRQSIISLEQGRCLPSLPLAMGISRIFDMAFEDIFGENRKEIKMARDLTPFSPMREVSSLHEAIDRLFEDSLPTAKSIFPALNVYEKGKTIYVEADVCGIKENDLGIEVGDDSLILSGKRQSEKEIQEKDYYRKEMNFGTFSRTIGLPATINKNKVSAELKDGTLLITLPKQEKIIPKVTKIKVKKS